MGMLYQLRTGYNVFYVLGGQLLHPIATVVPSPTNIHLDPSREGRQVVVGPTKHGLAVASMLSIALPFAVIRLQEVKSWQSKLRCLAIICISWLHRWLPIARPRSSHRLPPRLLVAYNRRMLRWAPVTAVVLIPVIHFAAPGALGTLDILADAGSRTRRLSGSPTTPASRPTS